MCGRFYIAPEAALEKALDPQTANLLKDLPIKFSGEIFPTDIVPVFTQAKGRRLAKPMTWGFPGWNGKSVIFNARQETALEKAMFKRSLLDRRVAVQTSGFYEWTSVAGQKKKVRYLFTWPGEQFLFLAGFWKSYDVASGSPIPERFTVLTTEANESMASYHNRMPIVLAEGELDDWLAGEGFQKYLKRPQANLKADLA
ncbi:MAG: SOS response-associated peptidase [Deltaproteobacteria bacterium]|jgi:putative SOS response-associated peptidase YedK|nr:SOS response-associated peptidase [Deltaproteobacteria bacterium]